MKPFVFFAVPSFAGTPCREFHIAISETQEQLGKVGIGFALSILAGDPYLSKVRNRLVASFLTNYPQATDFFFLDDDIGWPAAKVIEFIRRPEPVLCGFYPKKQDDLTFPGNLELDGFGDLIEQDGLYQAHLAPTGFMRIKRHVIEQMAMRSAMYYERDRGQDIVQWNVFEARYMDAELAAFRKSPEAIEEMDEATAKRMLRRAVGLDASPDVGLYWGEDFWFTELWREMGGVVWVDPEIAFTHRGSKAWAATFGDSVRAAMDNRRKAA